MAKKLGLYISIENHKQIFKENAGIFRFIPTFLIGKEKLQEMVEKRIIEELMHELPRALQSEMQEKGIRCEVDLHDESS